jgi:hypothetical protein
MTLINVDLQQSIDTFVRYIAAANQQNTDPVVLNKVYQDKIARLAQYMQTLTELAQQGLEYRLSPLLNALLQDWAIKEAVELLLRYQGSVIDPYSSGLQQSFSDKLRREHQLLSSQLLLQVKSGQERWEREAHAITRQMLEDQRQLSQQASQRDQQWVQDQRQLNQQFHNAASEWVSGQQQMNQQWFQHQQQMFNQHQQANREWANVAMVGVQQAQVGMKQWYDFAAQTQQNVASMLAHTQEGQGLAVQEALQKVESKKFRSKLVKFLILAGVLVLGLYLCGLVSHAMLMAPLR